MLDAIAHTALVEKCHSFRRRIVPMSVIVFIDVCLAFYAARSFKPTCLDEFDFRDDNFTREYERTIACGVCKRSLRGRFGVIVIELADDDCTSDESSALLLPFPFEAIVLSRVRTDIHSRSKWALVIASRRLEGEKEKERNEIRRINQ